MHYIIPFKNYAEKTAKSKAKIMCALLLRFERRNFLGKLCLSLGEL